MLALLLSYLLLYKYLAIFLVVFSAAIIIPWPVNTIILAVGAFSSQGYFSFWLSLAVALLANVLGDLIDYRLTLTYGQPAIKKFYEKRASYFVRFEKYVRSHAGLTIILSRFIGVFDVVVNFLSGLIGVPFKKFLFFDFVGNFIVLFSILALGYLAGSYWQNFTSSLNILSGIILVILLIIITLGIFYSKKKKRQLQNSDGS